MIKSVTVTNHLGDSIDLILSQPELSGFIVKSIDGLGPVNANINMTELATIDGAIDNSARLTSREITFSLGFLDNPAEGISIEDIRLLSYKYFMPKKAIKISIETDNRKCYTTGRVESNSPNIFDKGEGCQVVVKCADPYFYNDNTSNLYLYGIEPLFEFPFSNEGEVVGYIDTEVTKQVDIIDEELLYKIRNAIYNREIGRWAIDPVNILGVINDESDLRSLQRRPWYNMEVGDFIIYDGEPYNVYELTKKEIDDTSYAISFALRGQRDALIVNSYKQITEIIHSPQYYYDPKIEFGNANDIVSDVINYDGEIETGVILQIHTIGSVSGVSIYNANDRSLLKIDDNKLIKLMGSGFSSGDTLTIDTRQGRKTCIFTRNGIDTNAMSILGRPLMWTKLLKGDNRFYYNAENGLDYLQVNIFYNNIFEGV